MGAIVDRMSGPSHVRVSDNVVAQEVEGETVLLDLESSVYFTLDDVGTRCWQLLNEVGDVDGLVAGLLEEFDVDEQTLRHDVVVLLEQMSSAGLVTLEAGPATDGTSSAANGAQAVPTGDATEGDGNQERPGR